MTLTFTVTERESLALTERYYRDSPMHRRARTRARWTLPVILLPVMVVFLVQFGFSIAPTIVFIVAIVLWYFVSPLRFDARIRRYAKQQMRESSFAKSLGSYVVHISAEHLLSDGPTGHSTYRWEGVDRVVLTKSFLFVFLAGPMGLPISVEEIGAERAKLAYEAIQRHLPQDSATTEIVGHFRHTT